MLGTWSRLLCLILCRVSLSQADFHLIKFYVNQLLKHSALVSHLHSLVSALHISPISEIVQSNHLRDHFLLHFSTENFKQRTISQVKSKKCLIFRNADKIHCLKYSQRIKNKIYRKIRAIP